jgi:predicted small secreted protein
MCDTHEDGKKFVVSFVLMFLANSLLVISLVSLLVNLAGCNTFAGVGNTFEGFGKDIRAAAVGTQRFLAGEAEEDKDSSFRLATGD